MSGNPKNENGGSDCSSKWASEELGINDSCSNFGDFKVAKEKAKEEARKAQIAKNGGLYVPYDTQKADSRTGLPARKNQPLPENLSNDVKSACNGLSFTTV